MTSVIIDIIENPDRTMDIRHRGEGVDGATDGEVLVAHLLIMAFEEHVLKRTGKRPEWDGRARR